jgi:hypothetical protein
VSHVLRKRVGRQVEHEVSNGNPKNTACNLRAQVSWYLSPRETAFCADCECHRRVELRTRDGPKGENQRDKHRTRRERICEERNRHVPACKARTHNSGTDYGRK